MRGEDRQTGEKGGRPLWDARAAQDAMTIEQLKYFVAIEQVGSFSEAAEILYTTQSTVSKQVKALEEELGFKLFLRTTRRVEVTGAGKLFSPYAKRILTEYEAMQRETRRLVGKKHASIRVLSIPVLAQYGLVEAFADFLSLYPNVCLQMEERDSDVVIQALLKGTADIAILRSFHPQLKSAQNVRTIPIIWDELCLLVNAQHPLASREEVSLRELSNETFYFLSSHTGICNFCIAECSKAGFVPYIQQKELSRYTLQEIVGAQLVVSLMASKVAKAIQTPNICMVPLKEHPKLDLSFAVREDRMGGELNSLMHYINNFVLRRSTAAIRPPVAGGPEQAQAAGERPRPSKPISPASAAYRYAKQQYAFTEEAAFPPRRR